MVQRSNPLKLKREERGVGTHMHVRMSFFEGPPHMIDEGVRQAREVVLPHTREIDPAFKGIIALTERQARKMVWITFWESEEAMGASEEAPTG